jgi:hypothetical protein
MLVPQMVNFSGTDETLQIEERDLFEDESAVNNFLENILQDSNDAIVDYDLNGVAVPGLFCTSFDERNWNKRSW